MNEYPEYLFHYTSIENLCLILKNKSLRFSRLDKVNDPEEALTKDFPPAKVFVYLSSWTFEEDNDESLPLWKWYSSDMKGVRIRLPINMFKGRKYPEFETTGFPIIGVDANLYIKRGKKLYSSLLIGPSPVKYPKDPLNNKRCFTENHDGTLKVDLLHLGLSKYKYWHFENEWRYRIIGMPFEGSWKKEDYRQFLESPTNEYIDVPLDNSVFRELIVQLGPKATLSHSIIVELLLNKFAPEARLCDSSCKIKK